MEVLKINSIGQGMAIDSMRKSKLVDILKKETKTSDDFNFIDHYVMTYMPDLGKMLKSRFQKEACEKIYDNFKYAKHDVDDVIFDHDNYDHYIFLVLSGKLSFNGIKKNEEDGSIISKDTIEFYNKHALIHPDNLQLEDNLEFGKYNYYNCTCAEESEILSIDVAFYEQTVKEYEDRAKDEKIACLSKVFTRFKKLDKSSKEHFLTYFKEEKFSKGTVVVNSKSKIEEIYTIEEGKVALVQKNDINPNYPKGYIIFGVLERGYAFNEFPLLLEKENPYTVVCTADVKALVLDKNNFGSVCDNDTSTDLRANACCKERLHKHFLQKFSQLGEQEAEANQKKLLKTLGVEYKEIEQIFNKSNPKNTQSNQYLKSLEKFNALVGKPAAAQTSDPKAKFSEFATPRLVSKDPKFASLDPQRQLALLALRNEGAMRRSGNTATTTASILKNPEELKKVQKSLLNEEKLEKLMNKKEISESKSLKTSEEESKSSANNPLNKFSRKNEELLAKFGVTASESNEKAENSQTTEETEQRKSADGEENQVKFDKKVEEGDKFGLEMAKKNLMTAPLKKKSNLLSNPGML